MNLSSLTAAQLNQAAEIKDQIEALEQKLTALLSGAPVTAKRGRPKKVVAEDGEKVVAEIVAVVKKAKKRKMSAEGRAAIQAAQKARWAAKRAGNKGA